jgi:hypothetical protein
MKHHHLVATLVLGMAALQTNGFAQSPEHRWTPEKDDIYQQEQGDRWVTDTPITELAYLGETLFYVQDGALNTYTGDGESRPAPDAPKGIVRMKTLDGAVWAATDSGAWRFNGARWKQVHDQPMVDFCVHQGAVHGATRDAIFRWDGSQFVDIKPASGYQSNDTTVIMEDGSQVLSNPIRIGPIQRIASYSETLYLMHPGRLALLNGPILFRDPFDWGMLPSRTLRDLHAQGSRLYTATDRGASVLRGMALTTLDGDDRLPFEDLTCIASGVGADVWFGTTDGAIRKTGDTYHFFGTGNWLPGRHVYDIEVVYPTVYIATDKGLGIIHYEDYTLRKKAVLFEKMTKNGGFQRLGFMQKLWKNGDGWTREISDNDGGHTSHYLAAMSYKYAVTGDEQDRKEALDAFKAMVWLDDITPKDGFIARSVFSVDGDEGELATQGSGGLPAKWYQTDDKKWFWKGDTSSDEVNGHYYSVSLFHDLAAKGKEKDRAARHLSNISSHIMDNGWVLRDMDGEPTRWGRWDPEYLLRPYGFEARGLNGMEAQTYMWTSIGLSGDAKFKQGLDQLIKWRYHTYTVRQKLTYPPESIVPWDDELAFRCYLPLLTYADDPYLRSIYQRSLERHYEIMRMQKVAFFNFIYGALTGNDCEVDVVTQSLREYRLTPIEYSYRNSHRADLAPEPGYVPYGAGTRAISPRETGAMWGSQASVYYDGGNGGRGITPPVAWLEEYWMGRYYGMIEAPETKDPALITVPEDAGTHQWAKPYSGTPRPEIKMY